MSKSFDMLAPQPGRSTERKLLPIERATGMTEARLESVAKEMRETAIELLTLAIRGTPAHSGKALPDRRAGAGMVIDEEGNEV